MNANVDLLDILMHDGNKIGKYLTFYKKLGYNLYREQKGDKMKQPISPLQRLYNIEKTLFPNMEKTKSDVDNFEKILIEIYSEKRKVGI